MVDKLKNKKREQFCQEWLIDLNATQAAIRAGYSKNTANEQGARLLSYADIQARIAHLTEERAKRVQVTQDDVIRELKIIAFSKITDFSEVDDIDIIIGYEKDESGEKDYNRPITRTRRTYRLFKTSDMPADKVGAIASIKETRDGFGFKLHEKLKALELLGKHLGMFGEGELLEIRKKELELKEWNN